MSDKDCFDVNVEIRTMDQLGRIHEVEVPKATHHMKKCSYIKLVNIPSQLDIAGTQPDPTDESLWMSMIDYPTLSTISRFT